MPRACMDVYARVFLTMRARSSEIIENKSERRQLQQAVLDAQNNERDAKNELAEARPILISIHMPAADRTLKGYRRPEAYTHVRARVCARAHAHVRMQARNNAEQQIAQIAENSRQTLQAHTHTRLAHMSTRMPTHMVYPQRARVRTLQAHTTHMHA